MKMWQNKLVIQSMDIDFKPDSDLIQDIFIQLCEPLINFDRISYDYEIEALKVGNIYYSLNVFQNSICIFKSNEGKKIIKVVSYIVNNDKTYEYKNTEKDEVYFSGKLESPNFDYESIIDEIMNLLVE